MSCPIEALCDNSLYDLLEEFDYINRYGRHNSFLNFGSCLMGFLIPLIVYQIPCQLSDYIFGWVKFFFKLYQNISKLLLDFNCSKLKKTFKFLKTKFINVVKLKQFQCTLLRLCFLLRSLLSICTLLSSVSKLF